MQNIMLTKFSKSLEDQAKSLGFEHTQFQDKDFLVISEKKYKDYLKQINKVQKQAQKQNIPILIQAQDIQTLEHAINQARCKYILSAEKAHPKDSVHYLRGGLDLALLRTAKRKQKVICFSLSEFLKETSPKRAARLLARMKQNYRLCIKEDIEVSVSSFSNKVFSVQELQSFQKLLAKVAKPKN